jgi:hypothetical protein
VPKRATPIIFAVAAVLMTLAACVPAGEVGNCNPRTTCTIGHKP